MLTRLFPGRSILEVVLEVGGWALAALGLAMLVGALFDRVFSVRAEPASDADFSMAAMRDRRIRKMNGFYLRRGTWFLVVGAALLAIDSLLA